jgi:hypothetical protein
MSNRTKDEVKKDITREKTKRKRLAALGQELKTARDGWRGY